MEKTVCVTGANGFVASHLVKLLLQKGYKVHGTVRDPSKSSSVNHLTSLENASNLKLFKADLLNAESFVKSFEGCSAIFHTASPFFFDTENPEEDLIKPAVQGTKNVLETISKIPTIKTVIVTSSVAAVRGRKFPPNHVVNDDDWSDPEFQRKGAMFYPLSKTLAEQEVWKWEETVRGKIRVVTIQPPLLFGPALQPTLNTSTEFILAYINGSKNAIDNATRPVTDVRDVATAHMLLLEKEEAKGRYLCICQIMHAEFISKTLLKLFPERSAFIPKEIGFTDEKDTGFLFTCDKLKKLGFSFTAPEETIKDTIIAAIQQNFLPKI